MALVTVGAPVVTTSVFAQEEPVAIIGETEITQDAFYQAMKKVSGNVTLRTLILENVLRQNVEDAEALQKAADEEVAKQIEEVGGEENFQQLLSYQQLGTIEDYKYQIFMRNMFQEVVGKEIDMSDEAIQAYYENEYQPTMEAQHILVETEDEAKAALERIQNGEEFDAVAKEVSKDSSAENGGLLSPFVSGQMVKEFEDAVKNGTNGEIVPESVQSQYGFHIIKVLDNGEKKPLEEVRDTVEEQYKQSKFADSQFSYGVIGRLIEQTGLKINDPELQGVADDLIKLGQESVEESSESSSENSENENKEENGEATSEESATDEGEQAEGETEESSDQ